METVYGRTGLYWITAQEDIVLVAEKKGQQELEAAYHITCEVRKQTG